MNCADIQKKLSAYADNELSSHEVAKISEHLASCQECSNQFQLINVLQSKLTIALEETISTPDIAGSLIIPWQQTRRPEIRGWALAAAVLFVCAVCIITIFAPHQKLVNGHQTAIVHQKPEQPTKKIASLPEIKLHVKKIDKKTQKHIIKPKYLVVAAKQMRTRRNVTKHIRSIDVAKTDQVRDSNNTPMHFEINRKSIENGNIMRTEIIASAFIGNKAEFEMKHTIYNLPPNKDAATIERPLLRTVRNDNVENISMQTGG